MTVDELRRTAKDMGYNIIKIPERENLLPCTCGGKRRDRYYFYTPSGMYIKMVCQRCGREARGKTEIEARKNWNKMIKGEL